eukprot:101144-Karenia_brevis.AAC.1
MLQISISIIIGILRFFNTHESCHSSGESNTHQKINQSRFKKCRSMLNRDHIEDDMTVGCLCLRISIAQMGHMFAHSSVASQYSMIDLCK